MSQKHSNSRELRELAEDVVQRIATAASETFFDAVGDRQDLVTSLVRQWITYDGNAMLFFGDQPWHFPLRTTPLGALHTVPEMGRRGWIKRLHEHWKISLEQLPDVVAQVNRGQSAEVINADDVPVRFWVNPKERRQQIEPLVKKRNLTVRKPNYLKLATDVLESQLQEDDEAEDEIEELACSLVKQWERFDGHACLFLDQRRLLVFKFNERGDGSCEITVAKMTASLEPALKSLGLPREKYPEIIARINLGQEIDFQDGGGTPLTFSHNPQTRKLVVRRRDGAPIGRPSGFPPLFCPSCNGVLKPWPEGERQQTCAHCRRPVTWP